MAYPKIANQSDLVRGSGEQMRRRFRPQHFLRMWIECDYDRRSVGFLSMFRGRGDNCPVTEMDAIEYPDREKERTRQAR
jgi:hypothetical protein